MGINFEMDLPGPLRTKWIILKAILHQLGLEMTAALATNLVLALWGASQRLTTEPYTDFWATQIMK